LLRSWSFLVVALIAGCGTSVAQTASIEPREPLDCSAPGAALLPQNEIFAGGETRSPLVGDGYEAGAGPGLYLTARDAFRVLLNGELVVESDEARETVFVPLTLLPGDNVLSVVIAAESGTPAALLRIDELDRSYESDSGWKVSTHPSAGFALPGYDDSSWEAATDFGGAGALPGCEPDGTFPASSAAHWIGPSLGSGSQAVLRQVIRITPIGFGKDARGGEGSTPVVVETWEDLLEAANDSEEKLTILLPEGVHDFRDEARDQDVCPSTCSEDPDKPQYQVLVSDQTCANELVTRARRERNLPIASNKTIVGLGRGALVRGVTFNVGSSDDVIVRNVALFDVNLDLIEAGDAFTLEGASNVWLDHCTAKAISDGFTDIGGNSGNVTVSWMHYAGVTSAACDNQHQRAATVTDSSVTFHHCFFDHVESHSPSVRNAASRVHVFNSLLSDNLSYGIQSGCGAKVLVEGNTFKSIATPTTRATCPDDTLPGLIDAPEGSNFYGDGVGAHGGGDGTEPHDEVFDVPYDWKVDDAEDNWVNVLSRAGAGGPWALPLPLP
jgi:pectate lyase